jgi:hypothetical protein
MMKKKGSAGLALVILGVVTIIAIIGLVLLFTRASTTGQLSLSDASYGKAYVGVRGGLSYDKAHFLILGGRVEHIPQCRTIWGQRLSPDGYPLRDDMITCYVVQDPDQRSEFERKYNLQYNIKPGRLGSDVLCFLNDLGFSDLNWMNPADKVCIPDETARFNPQG